MTSFYSFFRSEPVAGASCAALLVLAAAAAAAPWLAAYDPQAMRLDQVLIQPGAEYWFGTDGYGRDIFTRLMFGARTALVIGVVSSLVGCALGATVGISSAYIGGRIDLMVQRVVDILLCFPVIILALVVAAVIGRVEIASMDISLILAIAIPVAPKVARVMRASALVVTRLTYVDAAWIGGYSHLRIIARHILPNVLAPLLIMATSFISQAILMEATLSFLGLGVTEPTPAWGLMLSGNATDLFREAPWVIIFPGLAISLTVLAFNLFGDGLRDWLDPRFET